ncbi:MAG: hypothetical protein ACRDHP_16760, partial [Ktedonobacterales bacterium]
VYSCGWGARCGQMWTQVWRYAAVERNEEKKAMRIEGTYTFSGMIDRVFAALTNAERLRQVLPGCERLVQLGPASPDGAASFQMRLRAAPGGGPVTMTATEVAARRPAHLRLELRGRTASGPVTGSGLVDLVAQDEYTIAAYVWDVDVGEVAPERQRAMREATQRYIRDACERLVQTLHAETERETRAGLGPAARGDMALEVTTPRGKIAKLPARAGTSSRAPAVSEWAQRAVWMTTGMLIGVSAIGLLVALGRWLNDHER